MNFEKTIAFEGDFTKAADTLKNTLLPLGFQVLNIYDNSIELEGTNSFMSQDSDPLRGISWIHVQKTNESLILKAELGGLKKTAKLLTYIIIAGMIINVIVLGIIFSRQRSPVHIIPFLASFIVVPIVIPLTLKSRKNQIFKSLDTLLNNMVVLGK